MKITTARYYTPSGRCIQELDYAHRKKNGDASLLPDSLRKEFRTAGGRVVLEAGGVSPDTAVERTDPGPFMEALFRKAMFFKFANHLAAEKELVPGFAVTDSTIEAFRRFLDASNFDFDEGTEQELRHVETRAVENRYSDAFLTCVTELREKITAEKGRTFGRYVQEIRQAIHEEVAGRLKGEQAGIAVSLEQDRQVNAAVAILADRTVYSSVLTR